MPSTTTVTPLQAASAASAAGFPAAIVPVMVAIAMAESSLNPNATHSNSNGSTDYGLWQINTINRDALALGDWRDPATNARMAYMIYQRQGLKAWTVYNTGAYQSKMPKVTADIGAVFTPGLDPISKLPDVQKAAGVSGAAIADAMPWFLRPDVLTRAAWFLVGVILIIAGMVIVFRRQAASAVSTGANLAAGAATGGVSTVAKSVVSTASKKG